MFEGCKTIAGKVFLSILIASVVVAFIGTLYDMFEPNRLDIVGLYYFIIVNLITYLVIEQPVMLESITMLWFRFIFRSDNKEYVDNKESTNKNKQCGAVDDKDNSLDEVLDNTESKLENWQYKLIANTIGDKIYNIYKLAEDLKKGIGVVDNFIVAKISYRVWYKEIEKELLSKAEVISNILINELPLMVKSDNAEEDIKRMCFYLEKNCLGLVDWERRVKYTSIKNNEMTGDAMFEEMQRKSLIGAGGDIVVTVKNLLNQINIGLKEGDISYIHENMITTGNNCVKIANSYTTKARLQDLAIPFFLLFLLVINWISRTLFH